MECAIASVLKDTKIIENYLAENSVVNSSKDLENKIPTGVLQNVDELANYLKNNAEFLKKVSSAVTQAILQNDDFKQSIYEALDLEYNNKTEILKINK